MPINAQNPGSVRYARLFAYSTWREKAVVLLGCLGACATGEARRRRLGSATAAPAPPHAASCTAPQARPGCLPW